MGRVHSAPHRLGNVRGSVALEETMSTSLDRSRNDVAYRSAIPSPGLPGGVDVPSMMAGRIGDLYAQEERRRRALRTEQMILRAQSIR